jgi:hypothetical protein
MLANFGLPQLAPLGRSLVAKEEVLGNFSLSLASVSGNEII